MTLSSGTAESSAPFSASLSAKSLPIRSRMGMMRASFIVPVVWDLGILTTSTFNPLKGIRRQDSTHMSPLSPLALAAGSPRRPNRYDASTRIVSSLLGVAFSEMLRRALSSAFGTVWTSPSRSPYSPATYWSCASSVHHPQPPCAMLEVLAYLPRVPSEKYSAAPYRMLLSPPVAVTSWLRSI